MHHIPKEYQLRTLETLSAYYQKCLTYQKADLAFYDITERPYAPVSSLPGMPYVCLRLPTGGGKTFVACHAVRITAAELLKTDNVNCSRVDCSRSCRTCQGWGLILMQSARSLLTNQGKSDKMPNKSTQKEKPCNNEN